MFVARSFTLFDVEADRIPRRCLQRLEQPEFRVGGLVKEDRGDPDWSHPGNANEGFGPIPPERTNATGLADKTA
jgi:hypothetical protein